MCGRCTISVEKLESILEYFKAAPAPEFREYLPRYNVAPSQRVPVIVAKEDGKRFLTDCSWGFVPPWGEKEGAFQANIRNDTIRKNRFFHDRLLHNRCVFVADGFYEWKLPVGYEQLGRGKKLPRGLRKTPYRIIMKNKWRFAMAGLWRTIKTESTSTLTAGIITTSPNKLMAPIHDRMPVVLSDADLDAWLDPSIDDFDLLAGLLDPFPGDKMVAYPVSDMVNNSRIDTRACIDPAV